ITIVLVVMLGIPIFIMKQLDKKLDQLNVVDMRLRLLQHLILTDCHYGAPLLKISESTETCIQNPAPRKLYLIMNRPSFHEASQGMRMELTGKRESNVCLKMAKCSARVDRTLKTSDGVLGRVFIKVF
ncbi:MAG: hypothetical protein ACXWTG_13075, partial [Methylosarcina sp.]